MPGGGGRRRQRLSPVDCLVAGDLLLLKRRLPLEILVSIFLYHLPPSTHCFRQQFRDEFAVLDALRAQQYTCGEAILRAISNRERLGVVKLLIDRGFDVNAYDGDYQETALMRAAANGNYETAELLLRHGARTEPTNALHETALLLSISHAHYDITHLLLQHGAFVNAVNDAHETPLIVACYAGHVRLVDRLLHHGADIGLADDRGVTALMVASRKGHHDAVQRLLQSGATDDDRDSDGRTALMLSVIEVHDRSVDIARLLLDAGSPIEAVDRFGQTALGIAASLGEAQAGAVQLLLRRKANGNAIDFEGRSVLMRSVAAGSYRLTSMLLNYGVAVNSSTRKKETALSIALSKGHHDVAALLIRNGAILKGKLSAKSSRKR